MSDQEASPPVATSDVVLEEGSTEPRNRQRPCSLFVATCMLIGPSPKRGRDVACQASQWAYIPG